MTEERKKHNYITIMGGPQVNLLRCSECGRLVWRLPKGNPPLSYCYPLQRNSLAIHRQYLHRHN